MHRCAENSCLLEKLKEPTTYPENQRPGREIKSLFLVFLYLDKTLGTSDWGQAEIDATIGVIITQDFITSHSGILIRSNMSVL
jgi:hypothetical protein